MKQEPEVITPATSLRTWMLGVLTVGDVPLPPVAPDDIVSYARDEGVLVLLASALGRLPERAGEQSLRIALQSAMRAETAIELERLAQTRLVLGTLSDAGIETLVLKGAALAYWLYPVPAQRPRCDLDILVASREVANRAVNALAGAGYLLVADVGTGASAEFEVALERRSPAGSVHTVDLHWRLVNHGALARGMPFDAFWAGRVQLERLCPNAFGLCRVHALVHALLHRITNFPTGKQDRLVWLYDIHLLASGCDSDEWQTFLKSCHETNIAMPCLDGLLASRAAFGTVIPVDVESVLRVLSAGETWRLDESLDQGAMDRAHLAALPWSQKVGWLWRKWFPSTEFMRHRYGTTSSAGVARAYLARWWVGIRRGLGL